MSVIAHLRIPSDTFELGRIMEMNPDTTVELESMIPLGEQAVPLFSVYDHDSTAFEESVRNHPSVERLEEVSRHDNQMVYALDWNIGRDVFFMGVQEVQANLLSATGTRDTWEFERTATDSVEEVLSDPEYDSLGLVAVEGRFGQTAVLDEPQKVTVVVKRPADTEFPDLAPSSQRRLTARMDRPIAVEVEFRETTVARPDRAAIPR